MRPQPHSQWQNHSRKRSDHARQSHWLEVHLHGDGEVTASPPHSSAPTDIPLFFIYDCVSLLGLVYIHCVLACSAASVSLPPHGL